MKKSGVTQQTEISDYQYIKNYFQYVKAKRDQAQENSEKAHRQASDLRQQLEQEHQLLRTAQSMLEGQARYLEDVSSREEKAAVAIERLQMLESEILHYIQNSRPLQSLNPDKIRRLIEISKTPARESNQP